ncbi:DUF4185 domain-containing protein [bacterium]|nr:DUF4185 domain-containing protein [bacterium]
MKPKKSFWLKQKDTFILNLRFKNVLLLILFALLTTMCTVKKQYLVGVDFESEIIRMGDNGDNWNMTVGDDGALYTAQCDGRGWLYEDGTKRDFKNYHVWRITGGPDAASFHAEMINCPDYSRTGLTEIHGPVIPPDSVIEFPSVSNKLLRDWNWYGYGIVSVDGNLYQFISHCGARKGWSWFDGTQLIWRPKGETNWKRWNNTDAHDRDRWLVNEGGNQLMFFNEPEHAFSFVSVAQFGKDYQQNKDGYVYLYSPEGRLKAANLNMARVKKEDILDRNKWEYFTKINKKGEAEWIIGDITKRGIVHQFPEGWGFYSWSPSVIWNEKLGLFIMVTGGSQRPGTGDPISSFPHIESGSLMFLHAENPWGPWTQFYWKENWQVGEEINRLYLPQLAPKWISEDGKTMQLVFSDAANSHSIYYKWNMQEITLIMSGEK